MRSLLRSVGLATAVVALGSAATVAAQTAPDDFPEPSTEQLAASVHQWDPSGSVHTWDPNNSVRTLAATRSEGATTVVVLASDILFAFGSADVPPAAADQIGGLVADAPNGVAVSIDGYTDSVGDDASNLTLSQQRADVVASIVAQARPDLVLTATGHGEADPVAPNEAGGADSPEGRAANRRVEIRYSA